MDNEASQEFERVFLNNNLTYQLTPPDIHCTNVAELAIHTYTNHFLSGLATVDPAFPIAEWDCLSSPMAFPGTKVVIHDKPKQQASWQYHGSLGFYIAPSVKHYRCMHCYIPSTRYVRVANTIQFFPHHIDFPALSLNMHLLNTLDTINVILRQKHLSPNDTSLQIYQSNMDAVQILSEILRRCTPPPIKFDIPPGDLPHGTLHNLAPPSTAKSPPIPKTPMYEAKPHYRALHVRTPSTTNKCSSIGPVCNNTVHPSNKPISAQLPRCLGKLSQRAYITVFPAPSSPSTATFPSQSCSHF